MSRSNPTDGVRNPSTRWFEWAGGEDAGFPRWYNKDTKADVAVALPFTFLFLDEVSTIKGYHKRSKSSIYANEIRDTRQEVLVVKSFKGGEIASGLYQDIKDKVKVAGGGFCWSVYLAYKDEHGQLAIGNFAMRGASLGAWMDFKKDCPSKKDESGKSVPAFYVDAVQITGYVDDKTGDNDFRRPVFGLKPTSPETNAAAVALDKQLQQFLADYFKQPKAEAGKPQPNGPPEDDAPLPSAHERFAAMEDDIPF
jgi:hypothetical protein